MLLEAPSDENRGRKITPKYVKEECWRYNKELKHTENK